MPVKTAFETAEAISLENLRELVEIISPFIVTIIALIIYAWRKMEKSQEKLQEALESHIKEDDEIHDKMFTVIRTEESKLASLIGAHNNEHGSKRGGRDD